MDHLLTVTGQSAEPAAQTDLATESLYERRHLQEWVIGNPQVLGESVLVVTSEYDRWADTDGIPARDRLDVLGLDSTGQLVVAELKRGMADRDVHLQAITYAALVSRFSLDTLAQAHRDFLAARGQSLALEECRQLLRDHVGGELRPELLRRPRQVIIAGGFPKQVTHTVVWLSEMNLDIDLVQVSMWKVAGQLVAGFTKVYPIPEVEEFTLAPARSESGAVAQTLQERSRSRNRVHVLVDAGLLPDGARLRLVPRSGGGPAALRAQIADWASEEAGRGVAVWTNNKAKPLTWEADGRPYTPTGLADHIFHKVTGRTPDGIQGTTWWEIDPAHTPKDVDADEWAALADLTLVDLANQVEGAGRDWTSLHTLLEKLPVGRWTTYGDLATVIGSHAVPVGTHLATCDRCTHTWRVLNAKGKVSAGFRWPDRTRTDTPEALLTTEGVPLSAGIAAPSARLSVPELQHLIED
ncbi:MGMT family protein [Streptomyces sp. NBC_00555]|uniref:MGMT family protein n=1 Tax=Streptomyces sp. NBC_00555 TaxID=2903662 RepID=UPI00224FF817|nr:MGMT family protein [Streptomyces sp. NBC_00555]MCX5013301.1 MGMT family protein [Streptomyces sp. NBC_00555]